MFYIGDKTDRKVFLYENDLLRHIVALGSSGSGKTVFCKILLEEAVLNNIPIIAIDPQGDICSLLLNLTEQEALEQGIDYTKVCEFRKKAQITVYTPGSQIGNEISLNPFHFEKDLAEFERIAAQDRLAKLITALVGYKSNTEKARQIEKFIYLTLEHIIQQEISIKNFSQYHHYLKQHSNYLLELEILKENEFEQLAQKIQFLTIGLEQMLFNRPGFSINSLLNAPVDKISVSIIYLNTLNNQDEKDYFISGLTSKLYSWMLQHPQQKPQLMFYFDEISPYFPAGNKKTLAKENLLLLFKQARKYGVSCIVASQNIMDLDYKGLSQFNTWVLGKTVTTQNLNKIKALITSRASQEQIKNILNKLTKVNPGEFLLLQNSKETLDFFKTRRLYTKHYTLNSDDLATYKRYYYRIRIDSKEFYYFLANTTEEQIFNALKTQGYQTIEVRKEN